MERLRTGGPFPMNGYTRPRTGKHLREPQYGPETMADQLEEGDRDPKLMNLMGGWMSGHPECCAA